MFHYCMMIWGCLSLLSIMLVSRNPEAAQNEAIRKLDFLNGGQDTPITVKEAYNSTRFAQICAMFMFGTFYGLYIASAYKVSADMDAISDEALTIAGSFGAICNGGSRILWASLLDKYSFKTVYGLIMLI
jgi:hypothetical protein